MPFSFNWRRLIPYGLGSLIPNPGAPAATGLFGTNPNWGQTGTDPSSGMSAFGSSVTQSTMPTYNPNLPAVNGPAPNWQANAASGYNAPAPVAPVAPVATAPSTNQAPGPSAGNPFGAIGSTISGAFAPGGAFGDAPGGGRPNTAAGGTFAGIAPWSAAGVAASAAAQNPGANATIVNQEHPLAHLGNNAQ